MSNWFMFEEPFYIFLVVPLIVSSLTTSRNFLFTFNIITLLIFSASFLRKASYTDVWVLLLASIVIVIFRARESLKRLLGVSDYIPLEGVESYIYKRDFKDLFSEDEFRLFFSYSTCKKLKEKKAIIKEGEIFDRVIYVAKLPEYKSMILKLKQTAISYLHEGAWLGMNSLIKGIIEFVKTQQATNKMDQWLVTLESEDSSEVTYFEWDRTSLVNLFEHSTNYKFRNNLLKLWLKYLSYSVLRLDDHLSNALRAMVKNDSGARERSTPIFRYISKLEKQKSSQDDELTELLEQQENRNKPLL